MKVSCLFDIGKDTDKLTRNEKIFYEDQGGMRRHLLSQEVDIEYEEEQIKTRIENEERSEMINDEIEYINADLEVLSPTRPRSTKS